MSARDRIAAMVEAKANEWWATGGHIEAAALQHMAGEIRALPDDEKGTTMTDPSDLTLPINLTFIEVYDVRSALNRLIHTAQAEARAQRWTNFGAGCDLVDMLHRLKNVRNKFTDLAADLDEMTLMSCDDAASCVVPALNPPPTKRTTP